MEEEGLLFGVGWGGGVGQQPRRLSGTLKDGHFICGGAGGGEGEERRMESAGPSAERRKCCVYEARSEVAATAACFCCVGSH